jgi:hypothetical protein
MSHCTRFEFAYTDEATIVAAFEEMGLSPTTGLVAHFSSDAGKLMARAGYLGKKQYRAICAELDSYQLFVVRERDRSYRLIVERHGLGIADGPNVHRLETAFRRAYLRRSLQSVLDSMDDAGVMYQLEEQVDGFEITFGPDLSKSLRVTLSQNGLIEEEVSGVSGSVCETLTADLEFLLAADGAKLQTTWKPEHSHTVEDQVVQVLRLA